MSDESGKKENDLIRVEIIQKSLADSLKIRSEYVEKFNAALLPHRETMRQMAETINGIYKPMMPVINIAIREYDHFQKMMNPIIEDAERARKSFESISSLNLSPEAYLPPVRQESRLTKHDVEQIFEETMKRILKKEREVVVSNKISLTKSGDLYRDPKEKYCYSLRKSRIRLGIVIYLSEAGDYVETTDITECVRSKNNTSVREAIGEINRLAREHLHLKKKFIIGKADSGYRINPAYEIDILDT